MGMFDGTSLRRSGFAPPINAAPRGVYWPSLPAARTIGVLAPDFWQSLPTDPYVPWPIAQLRAKNRGDHDFGVIARLKPGVTLPQAQVELSTVARRIDAQTFFGELGWFRQSCGTFRGISA
jgi:hypothetical protein